MIGNVLKYMRISNGLNQEQLGKILNLSQQNLSRYENNQRIISFDMIEKIAHECGYKIYFESKNERFEAKDLKRKYM